MRTFISKILILCLLCFFMPLPLHAEETNQSEIERYYTWLAKQPSGETPTFTMENDMILDTNLKNDSFDYVNINPNGHHIIVRDAMTYIENVHIQGNQDVIVLLEENGNLGLENSIIENTGGIGIQMKQDSFFMGSDPSYGPQVIGDPAIAYEGNVRVQNVYLSGPIAIQGTTGLLTTDFVYAQGLTKCDSLYAMISYFEQADANSITKEPLELSNTSYDENDPAQHIYLQYLKGTDITSQVFPYLQGEIKLCYNDETYATFRELHVPLSLEQGQVHYVYPDWLQAILDQNHAKPKAGFTLPQLHMQEFDQFLPSMYIWDGGGYYAYFTFPSLYGCQSVDLYISTDSENWECEHKTGHDFYNYDREDTSVEFNISSMLQRKQTYYFKYAIHGGIYDGYTCAPIKLTVTSEIPNIEYSLPGIPPQSEQPPDKEEVIPPREPEIPADDPAVPDPDPIIGNEGQGGGRGESDYGSSISGSVIPPFISDTPVKNKTPKSTGMKSTDKRSKDKESTVTNQNTPTTKRTVANTSDSTKLSTYGAIWIAGALFLILGLFLRKHHA